jgi:hypothetical protein
MSTGWNWDSPNPFLASECAPPPWTKGWGPNSRAGEGLGESQLQRQEKNLSTLPTLCYLHCRLVVFLLQIFANLGKWREAAPARLQLAAAGYTVAAALQQHQLRDRLIREKNINVVVENQNYCPLDACALGKNDWIFVKKLKVRMDRCKIEFQDTFIKYVFRFFVTVFWARLA